MTPATSLPTVRRRRNTLTMRYVLSEADRVRAESAAAARVAARAELTQRRQPGADSPPPSADGATFIPATTSVMAARERVAISAAVTYLRGVGVRADHAAWLVEQARKRPGRIDKWTLLAAWIGERATPMIDAHPLALALALGVRS